MKSAKTYIGTLMTVLYLFFPVTGLAFANHYFHDNGYPPVECSCCKAADFQGIDDPLTGDGEETDTDDHGCNCSSHLTTHHFHPIPSVVLTNLHLCDRSRALPEVCFPIFVPPRNFI